MRIWGGVGGRGTIQPIQPGAQFQGYKGVSEHVADSTAESTEEKMMNISYHIIPYHISTEQDHSGA